MRTKLVIRRVRKKIFFEKIENFERKCIIEKCVSCFLVYPFKKGITGWGGSLFPCVPIKKKVLQDGGFRF